MKPQILTAVRGPEGKPIYKPGMEQQLADAFDQKSLDRLVEQGFIAGNWKSFQTDANFLSEEETFRRLDEGDESAEVYDSLKYHQRQRVARRNAMEQENASMQGSVSTEVTPKSGENSPKQGNQGKTETSEGSDSDPDKKVGEKTLTENQPAGDLPEDFPSRAKFVALGFKTIDEVQKLSKDVLVGLEGIGEATADKALLYGK